MCWSTHRCIQSAISMDHGERGRERVRHVLHQSIHPSRLSYLILPPSRLRYRCIYFVCTLMIFHVYKAHTSSFMPASPCQNLTYLFPGSNMRCRMVSLSFSPSSLCSLSSSLPPSLPFPLLVPVPSHNRRATRIDEMWHVRMRRTRT